MLSRRALIASGAAAAFAAPLSCRAARAAGGPRPNFVVVLCDDLGYGDLGVYGGRAVQTPAIDRMAREGVMLTSYYAAANLCTPSRAGLLTGRYPIRTGLGFEVIMPDDNRGLSLKEVTIGEALKPEYATGLFGKWHLGHRGDAWPPTRHGFDVFFGIPYSHDMKPLALYEARAATGTVIKSEVDYPRLQQEFYAHAEAFIEANKDRRFFVELALSAPHLPEYPHPPFAGKSDAGAYGDVVAEIDSIVGRLLVKLQELELDRDTLVVFTSDNGPWFEGSAGGLRDRKGGTGYDGGYRVPFIARWPGVLPAGKAVDSIAMAIDLLPTFCRIAGKPVPRGVTLDGKDISQVLLRGARSPHDALLLFDNDTVVGVRTQDWKLVAASYYRGTRFGYGAMGYDELYDMRRDRSESYSLAAKEPGVLADMKRRLHAAEQEFGPLKHASVPSFFAKQKTQLAHMQD